MRLYTGKAVIAMLLTGAPLWVGGDDAFPVFSDVALELGVGLRNTSGSAAKDFIVESTGNGAGFFDYDNDGDMDLVIANGSTLESYRAGGDPLVALYRNDESRFVDATREAKLESRGWAAGVCVADYDNDGYRDVYATNYGPNVLYRNRGDGTFEDVSSASRTGDARWGTNCAFADYDRDGHLDLYVANYVAFDRTAIPPRGASERCRYLGTDVFCGPLDLEGEADVLYRNNGDGTFTDITSDAGIDDPGYYGFGVLFTDFDNDGWPDIYVANDAVPNFLFRNNRDGTFSEIGLLSGTAVNERGRVQSGMGAAAGDYDGNGLLDIFVTNFARDTNTLYENLGGLFFTETTAAAGLSETSPLYLGWGTVFADLDNDGREDLFIANGHVYPSVDGADSGQRYLQAKEVYRNLDGARFEEVTSVAGPDLSVPKPGRGAAYGDADNDGDLDIVVINLDEPPSLYRNDGGNRRHWVSLRLEGTRSNRDAIGARVELETGGRVQVRQVQSGGSYLSHNDMRLHFGLGEASRIDRIRIRWPNGNTEELEDVMTNQFLTIREDEGR